jgi:hypothetical protein
MLAFYLGIKMNIATAAHYLKLGYRVRRACWEPEELLTECADMLDRREILHYGVIDDTGDHEVRSVTEGPAILGLQDLLAEDWEIITSNIRKEFNKYGSFEYDDDIDFDNYELDYSYFED